MTDERTLIFVGAHPDDESFGLGGTLAKYAAQGLKVVYACGTRGELGSTDPEHLQGYATTGDMRWAELACAAQALGLADVTHLGYRDSGMPGAPDNTHPNALAAAPVEAVAARIVKVFREVKPQVVIGNDPIGGYRHPDHIALHHATVRAFHAAGDAGQFPELGPAYQPQKLYYTVFPRRAIKPFLRLLSLLGQDPRHFGRNKDIDLFSLVEEAEFPIHARIRISGEAKARRQAAWGCHKSQAKSGPPSDGLAGLIVKWMQTDDTFMRAHPPVPEGQSVRETDLFEGVESHG